MLLQTLLQLNLLLLTTPALAGWTLMPLAQPGAMRAACVVWQGRVVEVAAPKAGPAEIAQTPARRQPVVLPCFVAPAVARPVDQVAIFQAAPTAALVSFNPFPHATRAP